MKIVNRKALHDYYLVERFEAGVVLSGAEVKMIRAGRIDLNESFVKFVGYEPYLINAFIPVYQQANQPGYDPRRSRKLLLHKSEIEALLGRMGRKNLTIVPVSCYTASNLIKLELALVQAKNKADKREDLRRKALARAQEQELRGKV
ncbi:SsrA-binding protein SmpB [Candidatus Daviesbacteria bacterium]|nr:SsrA-binding protein SmpB [Candidatus Daviesbacteria bacterium]